MKSARDSRGRTAQQHASRYGDCGPDYRYRLVRRENPGLGCLHCCGVLCDLLTIANGGGGGGVGDWGPTHEYHWECEPVPPQERAGAQPGPPRPEAMRREAEARPVLPTNEACPQGYRLRKVQSESQKSCSRCLNDGKRWPTACCCCACCVDLGCLPCHCVLARCCLSEDVVCERAPAARR